MKRCVKTRKKLFQNSANRYFVPVVIKVFYAEFEAPFFKDELRRIKLFKEMYGIDAAEF